MGQGSRSCGFRVMSRVPPWGSSGGNLQHTLRAKGLGLGGESVEFRVQEFGGSEGFRVLRVSMKKALIINRWDFMFLKSQTTRKSSTIRLTYDCTGTRCGPIHRKRLAARVSRVCRPMQRRVYRRHVSPSLLPDREERLCVQVRFIRRIRNGVLPKDMTCERD